MTPEEACAYLDISMDDELSITVLERNYGAKISEFKDSPERRAKIEEAYSILLGLYRELYESDKTESQSQNLNHKHESMFMKMAVILSAVFVLCFAGIMIFVYVIHKDNIAPKREPELDRNYERVLRELENLQRKQEEIQNPQFVMPNPPADYADLVERVMPSIVFINTDEALGSGFFVSSTGDILTNYHVIKGAGYVTVTTHDGEKYNALLKDYDSQRDMALIKIKMQEMQRNSPFLKICNSLPRQGEAVIAIGNPQGLSGSVSNGIVSAIRSEDNNTWVQFTAPVSPGSSGGALLNLQGEIIGIPTLIITREASQNLNFAVASTVLNQFLSSAISKTAREIPKKQAAPRKAEQNTNRNSDIKFVRKDDGYEMYLYTSKIDYNRRTGIASFVTFWIPTEKQKATMRRHPDFNIPYGEDVGICMLFYNVNFRNNKYLHLQTINFSTNDTIIRNYIKPENEFIWRTPKKSSRIEALMNEVKKYLRI